MFPSEFEVGGEEAILSVWETWDNSSVVNTAWRHHMDV
jgi:hypothetical protein